MAPGLAVHCCVCDRALPEATAPALSIPFIATNFYLCDEDFARVAKAGGVLVKFAADLGMTPETLGRFVEGARGAEKMVSAARGKPTGTGAKP